MKENFPQHSQTTFELYKKNKLVYIFTTRLDTDSDDDEIDILLSNTKTVLYPPTYDDGTSDQPDISRAQTSTILGSQISQIRFPNDISCILQGQSCTKIIYKGQLGQYGWRVDIWVNTY